MSDSSPPPPKRSLVAPIVCSGLFVLAGAAHGVLAVAEHGATSFAAGVATAEILAPLVVAGLIGIFRRSTFFPLLGIVSVMGVWGTTGSSSRAATERAQRKEALAALEARMAEMRAKSNAAFWSGGEEVTDADIERIVGDIDRLAGKVPPADAAVFRCSAEGLKDLAKVASANRSATDAVSEIGRAHV